MSKKIIFSLGGIILLLSLSLVGYAYYGRKAMTGDYVIPGVPYVGIHNHKGDYSFVAGDVPSAMTSILEYWRPGENNLLETSRFFESAAQKDGFITNEKIKAFVDYFGNNEYTAQRVVLSNNELGKYINPSVRTPLYFTLAIDKDQPEELTYHNAEVLIGVKNSEKKVVIHNYWLGNNYEISFDDFDKMWDRMRSDERHTYIVIQPKNLKAKLKEIDKRNVATYPARTDYMQKTETMFKNFSMGWGAYMIHLNDLGKSYYDKVVSDPNFEAFLPPYYKLRIYNRYAQNSLEQNKFEEALSYVDKAIALDKNIDQPFNGFPGYEYRLNAKNYIIDKINDPYVIKGDIYAKMNDWKKASELYQEADNINPGDLSLRDKKLKADLMVEKINTGETAQGE